MNERLAGVLLEIAGYKDSCSTLELEAMLKAERACARSQVHAAISDAFDPEMFGSDE